MARLLKKELIELAKKATETYNPYIARAERYMRLDETLYGFNGKLYTKEELDEQYFETACKDIKAGFEQRMVGYYDKWYRYNHADEGRAYDIGCHRATEETKCPVSYRIIECNA